MEHLGNINNREIIYQKHGLEVNWAKTIPNNNWLLFALVESDNTDILDEVARKVIDNNVCYICCAGTSGKKMHDLIDENLVIRDLEIEKHFLPSHQVITTWHESIEDGLWFALNCAFNETVIIEKVYCLEIDKSSSKKSIEELIDKFSAGYIPE